MERAVAGKASTATKADAGGADVVARVPPKARLLLPHGVDAFRLKAALRTCEKIAAKDKSSLYTTSRFFVDKARYDAFIAMYSVMRTVDDYVDAVPDKARAPREILDGMKQELDRWEQRIRDAYADRPRAESLDIALAAAAKTFPVPIKVWLNFVDAMRFDIDHPRFQDFTQFLEYGEGATVAPTVIYVYLLTAKKDSDGVYRVDGFDFESCGRELGLFAYTAHILRDVKQDMSVGETGFLYLSLKDLFDHGLDEDALRTLLTRGEGDERWRALVKSLAARAHAMEHKGRQMAEGRYSAMERDCAFILCLITTLYSELLRRIENSPDNVLRGDPMLRSQEKAVIMAASARKTDYSLPKVMEKLGLSI